MSQLALPPAEEPAPTPNSAVDDAAGRPSPEATPQNQAGTPANERPTTAEDEDEADLDHFAEQWKAERHGQQVMRGAAASGTGSSATYIERQVTYRFGDGFELFGSVFDAHYLAEEKATYVEVDKYTTIHQQLVENNLLLLYGPEGSGRRATGLHLLTTLCPTGQIGTIDLRDARDLNSLCRYDKFTQGDGHLVDLTDCPSAQPIRQTTLENLANVVRDAKCYLVILIDESVGPDPRRFTRFFAEHGSPDTGRLLRQHLQRRLEPHLATCEHSDCPARSIDVYLDQQMCDLAGPHLHGGVKPRRLVELARLLVDAIHSGETLAELVDRWRPALRPLARAILAPGSDEDDEDQPHLLSRRQAFRLAYTVFNGHSHADVFRAAEILHRDVLPRYEVKDQNPRHLVIDGDVDKLLHPRMAWPHGDDSPRTAQLSDPKLLRLVLEVAWYEYDSLRAPLRDWLKELVRTRRMPVQVRAAQIGGLLATFEFDEVYQELIREWAQRSSVAYRTAAAQAMAIAFMEDQLRKRVREEVAAWACTSKFADSAARAYGTVIGLADPVPALETLGELGRRRTMAASNAVATSTASLFMAGHIDHVVDALGRWITDDSESLRDHAARTLLLLAQYSFQNNRADWPVLLDPAEETAARQEALVQLWRRALWAAGSSVRAWERLRRWLLRDNTDDRINASLLSFAGRIFDGPLRQRARFHLTLWRRNGASSRLIDTLHAQLTDPR